jgi:ABC-type polysaccharide/polyol phosphate export permease
MLKISARLFQKLSLIWLAILLVTQVAIYFGGEKPFSQGFVISLFAYLGIIMWIILMLTSYIITRIEDLEKKISEKK